MNKSEKLFEKALKLIPGGVNSPVRAFRSVGGSPFFTEKAKGALLTTIDGRELIDFVCSWGPAIHGHSHPAIIKAIDEALAKGTSFGTPNPYEVEMAEKITQAVSSIKKVRMVNSGTEATMSCIRLARGYTGRDKIIKFAGCYHGHVDSLLVKAGSGALTFGNPDSAGVPTSYAGETLVLPFNDIEAIENAFNDHSENIAGVILEPYPANNGLVLPQSGFLNKLRNLCDRHGSVLIFDEVISGFRIAYGGVQEKEGVIPDLTALGKIIGGGLPVGAFGGKAEIMDNLAPQGPVYQAGTLSGNPLAMAAGIAAIHLLETLNPYNDLERAVTNLRKSILEAADEKGIPLQMPHAGSVFCMLFSEQPINNLDDVTASNTELFKPLFHYALNHGVYLPPSAYEVCFISTAHDEKTLEKAVEVISDGIKRL
jgi:glutamate-1-semialdehyde 2,1-aminomutase